MNAVKLVRKWEQKISGHFQIADQIHSKNNKRGKYGGEIMTSLCTVSFTTGEFSIKNHTVFCSLEDLQKCIEKIQSTYEYQHVRINRIDVNNEIEDILGCFVK